VSYHRLFGVLNHKGGVTVAEAYKTLRNYAETEYVIKKSKFISYTKPVQTEQEAQEFIASIKQKHWDATHNVYAYSLREGSIKRYSDDGEPQGTAGMPVLNVITQEGITDCVVVVTRYFGGILLGGGGLVRAYSHSAKLAVDAAGVITLVPWVVMSICCDYNLYGKIESLIRDMDGVISDTAFTDSVALTFRIEKSIIASFDKKLQDLTNGKISFEIIEEIISAK
jgi:uncharacterized YigZ family protein